MNCKPGELAIIVKSVTGNEGKIVTCVRLASDIEISDNGLCLRGPVWVIDRAINSLWGPQINFAFDAQLRPIRPGDLHETEDERKEVTA